MKFQNSKLFYVGILCIPILYYFFPTNNSSSDAYAYAANVKYNDSLFSPHHLLYNWLLKYFYFIISNFGFDILSTGKILNGTLQLTNFFILYKILSKLQLQLKEIIISIFLVAFSFSSLRFGLENEAYIVPITFSLLGSYMLLRYLIHTSVISLFYCSIFISISCLFHQLHFFWWFGILFWLILKKEKLRTVISYFLPSSLIVFASYILVITLSLNQELSVESILAFTFYDYYSGVAKSSFGLSNLIFIIISSIRTFVQLHPNIFYLIKQNIIYVLPILLMVVFLIYSLKLLFKKGIVKQRKNINKSFFQVHLIILILHFVFAFYSVGNVEFLVMMPFLTIMTLLYYYKLNSEFGFFLAIILLVWNFSFGVYPDHKYDYSGDSKLVNYILLNPNEYYVVKNLEVVNRYYYKSGIENPSNIIIGYNTIEKRIKDLKIGYVITDIIDKPVIFNRSFIINTFDSAAIFNEFELEKIISYQSMYGTTTLNKVFLKK
jgi:hypothetical protein